MNTRENMRSSPLRVSPKIRPKYSICSILRDRELGFKRKPGYEDDIVLRLYNRLDQYTTPQNTKLNPDPKGRKYGGVFNLEFSQDGRLLVAACEEKSILLHDAANQKLIKTVANAHSSCVNCVRFLDSRVFATCSDDTSIKLWDIRNLRSETRTLYGHSNWVKNIEFSEAENMMVTSAFDGSIYAWNIGPTPENNRLYDKVFLMNGIMRTKLSPDGSKMVISTTNGFMIIIHDLHLATLANDLKSFKPILYRLMQISEQNFPAGNIFNYLFHPSRKKNRVEFIDDFPNDAEVISSLQIHPHGWNALSRNINAEENEDWTSVHDIQARDPTEDQDFLYVSEENEQSSSGDSEDHINRRPTDLWLGYISNDQYMQERQGDHEWENFQLPTMSTINSGLIGRNTYSAFLSQNPEYKNKIVVNAPRLTHFIKEKNVGKGYIKEVCFSPDGRVICSPYDKGVRLLGFNDKCQELSYCIPERPQQLATLVSMSNYHKDVVVCCKFSPTHKQLVSGCLAGDIVWYQPHL